jgi:hypothetical protein
MDSPESSFAIGSATFLNPWVFVGAQVGGATIIRSVYRDTETYDGEMVTTGFLCTPIAHS